MIILIDLVLHKTRAYRHVLFNKLSMGSSVDKGLLYRSTLIHIALDACILEFINLYFDFDYYELSAHLKQSITM